jgi:hypothetical protein
VEGNLIKNKTISQEPMLWRHIMRNLFTHPNNNFVYAGDRTSASPIRPMSRQCTEEEARVYDRIDKKIRELERQRKGY